MSILSDRNIQLAIEVGSIRIDPFDLKQLNAVSYDLTLGEDVAMYTFDSVIDVKRETDMRVTRWTMDSSGICIEPGRCYLMHTRERVWTDRYVPVLDGKSSVGRLFVQVHITAGFGDPGFDGQYTLEVIAHRPVRLYAGMRIAQMRFHSIEGSVDHPYAGNYTGKRASGPVASQIWRQFPQGGDT